MLFNFGKCECLHTGPGNTGMNYEMGGTILSKTMKEKDLGATKNASMKVSINDLIIVCVLLMLISSRTD